MMRCPAYPMCTAVFAVDLKPGPSSRIAGFYPTHERLSAVGQTAECPGSGARIFGNGEVHESDRAYIRRAGVEWLRDAVQEHGEAGAATAEQLLAHLSGEASSVVPRADPAQLDAEVAAILHRTLHETSGPVGRPAAGPRDIYFPGRPADAPEPGRGERPAGRVPMDVGGGFLGRAAMDNARDQLVTLVGMIIDQIGQTQDTLARMTGQLDGLLALAEACSGQLTSAESLTRAAVGSGTGTEPAERLREQLILARATVSGPDGVPGAAALARIRVGLAFTQLRAAAQAAEEYRVRP
jgi:hypothetical protein